VIATIYPSIKRNVFEGGYIYFVSKIYIFNFLNASLDFLFDIASKRKQKTLARCKPNNSSFHYEKLIYLTLFAHIRVTHFSSTIFITSNLESALSCIWRCILADLIISQSKKSGVSPLLILFSKFYFWARTTFCSPFTSLNSFALTLILSQML